MRPRRLVRWTLLAALACLLAPASSHAGQPRAYAFFSQYCQDCAKKAPVLRDWVARNQRRYRITGVGFMESSAEAKAFARNIRLHVPVHGDPSGELAERLGIWSPTVIVLTDARGKRTKVIDYAK